MTSVNFQSLDSILGSFDNIASRFANDFQLQINDALYRIVDMEFYAWSENFQDPHTYKHELQQQAGKLYMHGSGLDITFGDEVNYCGMLIRGVVKLYGGTGPQRGFMGEQIYGPQKVATELLSNIHGLDSGKNNIVQLDDINGRNQDASFYSARKVIKTTRVGLTKKQGDAQDEFMRLKLRYVVILPQFPQFKQTVPGVEALLGEQVLEGKMSIDEAQEILGYKKSF